MTEANHSTGGAKDKREAVKTWTESIKNIVQILAIIVGGAWAYWTFGVQEEPALEARAEAVSGITWSLPSTAEDECVAQFRPTLKNIGASSFDVSAVHIRGWTFERQLKEGEIATFIDSEEIQSQAPFFDEEFKDGPFVERYAPGESFFWTYEWVVKPETEKLMLFRVDFEGKDDRGREFSICTLGWSFICAQH